MQAELIDRIYECSLVPELWPEVLDELAGLTDSQGGLLFAVRDKVLNWTSSPVLSEVFQSYVSDGWFKQCTRRVCLFSNNLPSFFTEHDFWSPDQIDANPIYRDFFRPRGLGWSAGTGLMMPTGDNIVFSVERNFDNGPIEQEKVRVLNELRPHLARAALIASRLGLKTAKGTNSILAELGLPALVFDESGVVIEANPLMNDLTEHVKWQALGKIRLADVSANALLYTSLPALDASSDTAIHSFPLRDGDGRAALVAHVVPIRRSAHDIFGRSFALMILTPITARKAPPVELLRSLFDLTVSEARVARAVAQGESLDDIATAGGVSKNTVRSQLQQVMDKVGCSRQAEITAMLANISLGQSESSESPKS